MKQLIGFLLVLLFFASCETDGYEGTEENNNARPLVFYSLVAEKDTLTAGETTKITAMATGYDLTYGWSATEGSILGSGNEITYAACSCQAGTNIITCTVSDRSNASESKEVSIVIH